MAKKFVRGITDVKTINNQDFDTNNVTDLLSDGQYNYIHRKKGKTEEYHNLTDNIKTISSDNTELLSVTNNNKTTNTATLHPKHDSQKEQLLESTRNTISIHHGTNGTAEKTTVDTNPKKVLEHENLISDSEYITLNHQTDENTTHIQAGKLKEKIDDLQQNKQGIIRSNISIGVTSNNELRQLIYYKKTYTNPGAMLKTYLRSLSEYTNVNIAQTEYNFTLRINQGQAGSTVNVTETDKVFFKLVLGSSNTAIISGCSLTLNEYNLTVSTDANTVSDLVITFSDIVD